MSENDIILPTSYIPSVGEFLDIMRIRPTGFAAQLFTGVYDQFFAWSKDLRDEYNRYYCVEYSTFAAYLELAHEIYLEPAELENAHVLKVKAPAGVVDDAYDDNVRDIVIDCLRKLEDSHES
ncbi:MAG: hypothetical protein JWR80_8366 [Bradyrhizobium sp.]|nr:hypothetical protein [Bradyrhizobium sp.]